MQSKKLIPGLDVMKFIMAFLIVDIHVKGYLITPPNPTIHNTTYRRTGCSGIFYHLRIPLL